jgi:serine/threonine protein phosphatase 1
MNYFAFGDIHGEFYKLDRLVRRLHIKNDDVLVFLGDYIDRGKHSFEVIDYLVDLSFEHNCVFLKGNHEDMFVNYLKGWERDIFLWNGGRKTIKSYKKNGYDIGPRNSSLEMHLPKSHVTFLQKLKLYHETDEFIFVHAGIFPDTPLENLPAKTFLWTRGFHFMKYEGKPVVFGHTPNEIIMNEPSKICIDTGACFDSAGMGNLTCVKLPERIFTQQGPVLEDLEDD